MAEKSIEDRNWLQFYRATAGRPPRPTLLRALSARTASRRPVGRRAIDLGCGTGRDTLPLLAAGWHVLAIDPEPVALRTLEERTPLAWRPRLTTRLARLEATSLPAAELVNASFSLIFAARPPLLAAHLRCIHAALVPGGRFAGQLLGPRDSWALAGQAVGVDRCRLAHLLAGFELEHLVVEETDAVTPKGEAKHWHIWHVNARKAVVRSSSRRS
jgi:SAM-dependent methyltransferase